MYKHVKAGDRVKLTNLHPYRPEAIGIVTKVEEPEPDWEGGIYIHIDGTDEDEKDEFAYDDEYIRLG